MFQGGDFAERKKKELKSFAYSPLEPKAEKTLWGPLSFSTPPRLLVFHKTRNCINSCSVPKSVSFSLFTPFLLPPYLNPMNHKLVEAKEEPETIEIQIRKLFRKFCSSFHHSKSFPVALATFFSCRSRYLRLDFTSIGWNACQWTLKARSKGKPSSPTPSTTCLFSSLAQCSWIFHTRAIVLYLNWGFGLLHSLLPHIRFSFLIEIYYQHPQCITPSQPPLISPPLFDPDTNSFSLLLAQLFPSFLINIYWLAIRISINSIYSLSLSLSLFFCSSRLFSW